VGTTRFISAPDQGDVQVVVLAAELHEEAVSIVLATTISDELAAAGLYDPNKPGLTIEDDVGTEYRRVPQLGVSIGAGWHGSHGVSRSNPEYEPAVPPEATRLRIRLGRRGSVVLTI